MCGLAREVALQFYLDRELEVSSDISAALQCACIIYGVVISIICRLYVTFEYENNYIIAN